MESNIPAVESANVWGLVNLKKGQKRRQQKILTEIKKSAKLIEPINEVADERRARRIAFRSVKRELTLWKGPVHKNRLADQLIFPLNDTAVKIAGSEEAQKLRQCLLVAESKKRADTLQGKLYSSLYSDAPSVSFKEDAADQTSRVIRKKLLEQIAMRQKERFLTARAAAKNKRQNKIKSKNFHRHQKARSLKEYEKEMEKLRDTDPRKFAEHILEAEKKRAQERASLRHRGGSKFARLQKLRAKYDTEARDAVAEMYERSKELTKRTEPSDSSESEVSDIDCSSDSEVDSDESEFNASSSTEDEAGDTVSSKLWWRQVPENEKSKPINQHRPTVLSTLAADAVLDQSTRSTVTTSANPEVESADTEADVFDPDSDTFFRALEETCATDPSFQQQFQEEKEKAIDEETPKDIDTFLPGWNAWTGPGLEAQDEVRRKKRIIPAPKVKRQDTDLPHVLIRRRVNNEFRQHLVKSIPFPYNTPEQFESVVAQPISREWVTECTHREFTRPKVTVQAGRIIRPITKSASVLRDKDVERLTKRTKHV
ncbi:hypothetical protein CRM22_005689 [Opisthorchis felineus]|uniref:U3 small nucleolar RNA-associated protein 14 homolog A n=1 Tax=Opisthorchis felineus TaxID=147828 RepID=A0A4S2LPU9_OPIFE|nr:hypothetical protein CRM22_005689 [Opisthorchis felineus]